MKPLALLLAAATLCAAQFSVIPAPAAFAGGIQYMAIADKIINSTTPTSGFATTARGTTSIAANTLIAGKGIELQGTGIYSTPVANLATVTLSIKFGSLSLATVTTAALPASSVNLPFNFDVFCTVRTTGAAGTMVCNGTLDYQTAVSNVVKTSNALVSGIVAIDTTTTQSFDVLVSWSAVSTQAATVQQAIITFLN